MPCFILKWGSHNLPSNKSRNLVGVLPIFTSLPLIGEKCVHLLCSGSHLLRFLRTCGFSKFSHLSPAFSLSYSIGLFSLMYRLTSLHSPLETNNNLPWFHILQLTSHYLFFLFQKIFLNPLSMLGPVYSLMGSYDDWWQHAVWFRWWNTWALAV